MLLQHYYRWTPQLLLMSYFGWYLYFIQNNERCDYCHTKLTNGILRPLQRLYSLPCCHGKIHHQCLLRSQLTPLHTQSSVNKKPQLTCPLCRSSFCLRYPNWDIFYLVAIGGISGYNIFK